MKFGKQLELGIHDPWKDYYIQYGRLKRIIKRRKYLADKAAGKESQTTSAAQSPSLEMTKKKKSVEKEASKEYTKLLNEDFQPEGYSAGKGKAVEENSEFFFVIHQELEKINNFFVGKLAELHSALDKITSKRENIYLSHHTSKEIELSSLRDLYIDLMALRSYCDLNQTGFYKIIKKYDKVMEEQTLEKWIPTIDRQHFVVSPEPRQLLDVISSLVSRDKLIEWDMFASEKKFLLSDDIFSAVNWKSLSLSLFIYLVSLAFPLIMTDDGAAQRCLSLLLLAISLWVTQALPYFATALLIPSLTVFFQVLRDPRATRLLTSQESAAFVTSNIFNHTTWLLLGGYTISTAFARCQLELRIASGLQGAFGHKPKLFILAVMMVGLFLSMWISNHTAPILCSTIILPIVRDLPTDSRFSRSLLLGLAFACNFGGMLTPISSLQNALAASYLVQYGYPVAFGEWIAVALPFGVCCTLLAWGIIILIVRPDDIDGIPVIVLEERKVFTKKNIAVIVLSLMTIILFATSQWTEEAFGDIAIISLSFVAVMFSTGILTEVDFNAMSWHTLFLIGGGNVLGKAVASSGLLNYIANDITLALPLTRPWLSVVLILLFCCSVATFVSHTVAAIILMPVVASIGVSLHMPQVTVVGTAFAISAAMALPFSSFPNVNSLLMVDDFRKPFLGVNDFLSTGLPMTLISLVLTATVGFALINLIIVNNTL